MTHSLEVWGDHACFTRPELKVERVSYPVITPSAARGIFDAIFWAPELRWQIQCIEVLNPILDFSLRRNEVKAKVPNQREILAWAQNRAQPEPLRTDDPDKGRTLRLTRGLRDVRYRLHAIIDAPSQAARRAADQQFQRRVHKGQCHHQPYLGCREFVAYFQPATVTPPPSPFDLDIGLMLYDIFDRNGAPSVSLFRASIRQGVLEVPAYESDLVLKPCSAT